MIGVTANAKTMLETWELFFSSSIQQFIISTNILKPYLYKVKYDVRKADIAEIKALIGVLYLAGIHQYWTSIFMGHIWFWPRNISSSNDSKNISFSNKMFTFR